MTNAEFCQTVDTTKPMNILDAAIRLGMVTEMDIEAHAGMTYDETRCSECGYGLDFEGYCQHCEDELQLQFNIENDLPARTALQMVGRTPSGRTYWRRD